MHLQDYVAQALREVAAFEKEYLANHAKDPDSWPLEMGEGEWFEQEIVTRQDEIGSRD